MVSISILNGSIFSVVLGAQVAVLVDDNKALCGLFFQDQSMIDTFNAYPEIIFVDATYKLLELSLPVFLILCEDSNGCSEVVGVCLLVCEDLESMKWMMETFKQHIPRSSDIRIVMSDRDIKERDAFKSCLPNARTLICLFHTLRSFHREVSCEKMEITKCEREFCLELLQKMAYASIDEKYDTLYDDLKKSASQEVLDYFDKNWHPIRDEWVLGAKASAGNFLTL